MKKTVGFIMLLAMLSIVPAAFTGNGPVMLNDAQMARVHGAGVGCDLLGGVSIGLGIGACFGCLPCGAAGAIGGAIYYMASC